VSANLSTYLSFRGNAREAMEFYAAALGGTLTLNTFAEFGGMGLPEDEQQQVMHSQVDAPGVLLMGSDTPSSMEHEAPAGFSVCLSGDDEATLRGWWSALSEGATITVPLEVAPWGDAYGQLVDRFGVSWMANIAVSGTTS
jgi:PhnB protein